MSQYHNIHRTKWQRFRNRALKQQKHICQNPFHLHDGQLREAEEVHHILPAEDYYPFYFYNLNNLLCLCPECHKEAHRLLRECKSKYLSFFDKQINKTIATERQQQQTDKQTTGVLKSLNEKSKSPRTGLLSQVSNGEGNDLNNLSSCATTTTSSKGCFFDINKRKFYCSHLRQYRSFPCSTCQKHFNQN